MNENNLPTENTAETANGEGVLASRWDRFAASLLDSFIMMIIVLPLMYFTGAFDGISQGIKPSMTYNLFMGLVSFFIFLVIQGKFLIDSGQTIGKKAVSIKIVTLDGNLPTFTNHLLKRYAFYFFIGQIPFIGQIISIVNILFIFGSEKRCIHDHVAGTKVVKC